MNSRFGSSDRSVVVSLALAPAEGPDGDGTVTVSASGGTLTVSGTAYSGVSGDFTLQADGDADPNSQATPYNGTFELALDSDDTAVISGSVTGSIDANKVFRAKGLTDVTLSAPPFTVPPGFNQTLNPMPPVAMGTASVIIKPGN